MAASIDCSLTVTARTLRVRRVRTFPLPSAENRAMFLSSLEFLVQAGVGLVSGQGSDPVFFVELSYDGGQTYGPQYVCSPGKLGDYTHRHTLTQLGMYRNAYCRLTMTDPCFWALIDCFGDIEPGSM